MKTFIRRLFIIALALTVSIGFMPLDDVDAATIKLNKTKVTVYAGKTVTLKIKGTSKKVTWTSSNKTIATVYKGKVTTKKPGKVTITAKVSGKSYKCKVTVKKPYLNKKTTSLYVGQKTKLKLTGATAKSYSSKSKSIASVSKYGTVTANKKGTTKITVKDTKGRYYYCTVTVKNPYLNQTEVALPVDTCTTLTLTGATAKSWSSSDETIVTVSEKGLITGVSAGTATVTCEASNGHSYKAVVNVLCREHVLETKVMKEATCQKTGTLRTYCVNCAYYYDKSLAKVDHDYQYAYTVESKSCDEYGRYYYLCTWCEAKAYIPFGTIEEHNYVYTNTVTASKEGPGHDAYTCSKCGDVDQRNVVDYNPTATQVYKDMIAKKAAYPEGMAWTNANYYKWNAGYFSGGYGCAGFAFMLSDAAFGYLPAQKHTDFNDIKVGDILRVNNNSHSVVVIKIKGTTYTLAEGNYNSSIHWGRTMTLSEIKSTGTYVMTRYPQ